MFIFMGAQPFSTVIVLQSITGSCVNWRFFSSASIWFDRTGPDTSPAASTCSRQNVMAPQRCPPMHASAEVWVSLQPLM